MNAWGPPGREGDDGIPADWWGGAWTAPYRRTVSELIADDVLDRAAAEFLTSIVRSGASLTIAAGPGGAGKTTIMTSLLDFIPSERRRVFVRGAHHVVDVPDEDVRATTLLINEISPHLPCYVWGNALRAALRWGQRGAQLLATTHAERPGDLVYRLATSPMRLTSQEIASLGVVAFLDGERAEPGNRRALGSIVTMSPSSSGGLDINYLRTKQTAALAEATGDVCLGQFRPQFATACHAAPESG